MRRYPDALAQIATLLSVTLLANNNGIHVETGWFRSPGFRFGVYGNLGCTVLASYLSESEDFLRAFVL